MTQQLINPIIEYGELTRKDAVERLDQAVRIILKTRKAPTLESYFLTVAEERRRDLFDRITELTSDGVKLSLTGELSRKDKEFCEKIAKRPWYEFHIMAARNFQKVKELSSRVGDLTGKNAQYMYSFMSAAEFHNAMQHSCAYSMCEEALPVLDEIAKAEPGTVEQIHYGFHKILLRFFAGDFRFLGDNLEALSQDLTKMASPEFSNEEVFDFACIIRILGAIAYLTEFVLTGNTQSLQAAKTEIEVSREMCGRSGRPDLRYIGNKLSSSFETVGELSLWNLRGYFRLDDNEKERYLKDFILNKIANSCYLLFPSQHEALNRGLLSESSRRILLSTPTGAGKTLLAELIILAEVLSSWEEDSLAIYMVPSRALAREKYSDLKMAFNGLTRPEIRVCQITGEAILDAKTALESNDVVVLTPEKFDMVLRHHFYERKVRCLVVDEFHNLSSGYRGIRIQFNLIRFKNQNRDSKTVLISAIVSNFEDIRTWFEADRDFETTWRPTFARVGIFDILGEHIIKFTDGASVEVEFDQKLRANAYQQQAAHLAASFAREGATMIFCSGKAQVYEYGRKLVDIQKREGEKKFKVDKNQEYASQLKRIIGEEEEIFKFFINGVGVHRGDLPHVIRKIVEEAVRNGALNLVVSTTTLAEGINLPLRTIVVPIPEVGGEELRIGLFFNLLGRAGRPRKEIEGQVIFLTRRGRKSYSKDELQRYQGATRKDIEAIITPVSNILNLQQKLDEPGDLRNKDRVQQQLEIHKAILDTVLLASVVEGVAKSISHNETFLDRIIIGQSRLADPSSIRQQIGQVLTESEDRLSKFGTVAKEDNILVVTAFGKVVYKTGFSPATCKLLLEALDAIIPRLNASYNSRIPALSNWGSLIEVLAPMATALETKAYFSQGLPSAYVSILADWMKGRSSSDLARVYFSGKISEALVVVEGLLAGYSSWFLYALGVLMEFYAKERGMLGLRYLNAVKALPRYSYYGTTDRNALHVLQSDASKELLRDDVLAFVSAFERKRLGRILRDPRLIDSPEVADKLKQVILRTDATEFLQTLKQILS